jgi:hypothetical protein
MTYLITQTLLSAWNYAHDCHISCSEEAYKDFLDTLNRVQKKPSDAMLNGILFENAVYRVAKGYPSDEYVFENGVKAVADVIRGGAIQVKLSRDLRVDGRDFVVYGIADVVKAGTIYDVKFSNKDFASAELPGRYLNSPQHPAYLYALPEARDFVYLVSDGEDLYTERYDRKNTRPIGDIVKEFMDFLTVSGLMNVYEAKWGAYS